jgi:hypothetical protein
MAGTEMTEVPASFLSGEKQEKEEQALPSPAPPVIQQHADAVRISPKPVEKPAKNQHIETGSSDALYQARVYVLTQIEKKQPIDAKLIAEYTGWDSPTVRKFVNELQDEWNRRKPGKGLPLTANDGIQAGFDALAKAIYAPDMDEEPDAIALEDIEAEEEAVTVAAPSVKSITSGMQQQAKATSDRPVWWSDALVRYCQGCGEPMQPRKIKNHDKSWWETRTQYETRKNCSIDCRTKAQVGVPKKKEPSFRPEA